MKKNKETYEKKKKKFKKLKLFFSIISILMMLAFPIHALATNKGNYTLNIVVLAVSIIYGFFWLLFGSNKAYKMNRIYKYTRLFLTLVSLCINAYSIYVTSTNFNLMSVIISFIMGISWIFNVVFNILYDFVSYKINKFIENTKENIEKYKQKKVLKTK